MATPVPQKDDVEHWTVEQVAAWLQQMELSECCDTFLRKGIDGHHFLQLSEEDLKLWGRDVSIRTRKQILKLVSQIKNLQQYPSATRPSIDIHHGYDSQQHAAYDDDHANYSDDFSDDEDVGEENPVAQVQPVQHWNVQDDHSPMRPPFPTPRTPQKAKEGEECHEDIYLDPIEPSPKPNHPSLQKRGLPQPPPQLPFPRNARTVELQNCGHSRIPPGGGRGPAPLPPQLKTSQSKEKNDHVYETVDTPKTSCGFQGFETSNTTESDWPSSVRPPIPPLWNQNQDFDDQDLSSQLEAVTFPPKKQAPPLGPRSQIPHPNRPLKPIGAHRLPVSSPQLNPKTFTQETQAPQFPSLLPKENQPYVNLDDGKRLLLTSLHQKIMEKPYFHLVSRTKAKALMLNGGDGMFLIRPSTRSGDPFTLSLKLDNHPYNINIRQRPDSLFALGTEKAQEKTFSSVDELISIHSREPIKLENGKVAFLKYTPTKKA